MKAVVVIEWDLDELDTTPGDWHRSIQQFMDAMPKDGMVPVGSFLAIMNKAQDVMDAYHSKESLLPALLDCRERAAALMGIISIANDRCTCGKRD